jgi:hypothetical protein
MADEKEVEIDEIDEETEEEEPKLRTFKISVEIAVNDEELGVNDITKILKSDMTEYEFIEYIGEFDITVVEE